MLEVGTGLGYQATVLAELVDHVYTIEIIKELSQSAKKRMKYLGYENIAVKSGDGYYGWEKHAPYDAIIVTAAPDHIPPPLVQQHEARRRYVYSGRQFQTQNLTLRQKTEEGSVKTKQVI